MNNLFHLFILVCLLVSSELQASLIGYGSSTSTLTAKNQENILMGFELGFKQILGDKASRQLLIHQNTSGAQLGALESLKFLLKKNVIAITGFSGSHDSVLAGNYLKDKKLLTIFPGSNHNSLKEMGSTIFTTGHSMNEEVKGTLSFINKHFKKESGFAIINKYAVASSSIDSLLNNLSAKYLQNPLKLSKLYLSKDLMLSDDDLSKIKKQRHGFIYYTAYPEAMIKVVNQLEQNGIDLPVIAASSWGLGDADLLRRFNTKKKAPLYISSEWNISSLESRNFTNLFKKNFGRDPGPENALGYDVGIIMATTIKRVKGGLTSEKLLEAFHQDLCFKGLSVGPLCFEKEGGHSNVKPKFYKFDPASYKLAP